MAVRGNFTETPIIIGGYSASRINCEPAARWKWVDHFTTTAKSLGMVTMLWDNGLDNFDRYAREWRDPTTINIIQNSLALIPNSLPDSTTDPEATSQWTSAYIFHKVGDPVTSQTLPILFNYNTLVSIMNSDGKMLAEGTDYTLTESDVTVTADFLSRFLSADAEPGFKSMLTLAFSGGTPFEVEIIQWDTPTLDTNSSTVDPGFELQIPVTYKGLNKVAAVKIVEDDGVYFVDDWTEYLGPLQQGRGVRQTSLSGTNPTRRTAGTDNATQTYRSQWDFDGGNLFISAASVQAVANSGRPTTFTFEFYPRVPGNSVDYTLMP